MQFMISAASIIVHHRMHWSL